MIDIKLTIIKLLNYALKYLDLRKEDLVYFYNVLSNILQIDINEYDFKKINIKQDDLYTIINDLNDYINEKKFDLTFDEILSMLTPTPSSVINKYNDLSIKSKKRAFNYLYHLQINNNYIKKRDIQKNIVIKDNLTNLNLVVTINLSKPEKSNKDIVKSLNISNDSYPKCPLCYENVGYSNKSKSIFKKDLRAVPLRLNKSDWFMQFSPYSYFYQHIVVIKKEHVPMAVDKNNISALLDFAKMYKFLFIGSNADIPIVGGSILNHEHFQGGNYIMPIMKAKIKKDNIFPSINKQIKSSLLSWPCTTFKFVSKSKKQLVNFIDSFLQYYKNYSDEEINLISNNNHNTITIIARYINNQFEVYAILRNNRTDDKHPNGIFHVDDAISFIKSEGIGLIEAMGLFILPGRLKNQLNECKYIIENPSNESEIIAKKPYLENFKPLIDSIKNKKYKNIEEYLIYACRKILFDINVFKYDKDDIHLNKFIDNFCKEKTHK